jgi:outer membrane protein OmpA-like peptidoglycan-associated protein
MLQRALMLSAGVLALTAAASSGYARPSGWYLGLGGGVSKPESTDFVTTPPGAVRPVEFDTGWAVMGSVGYRWDSNWRLEFELAFRQNDWETKAPGVGSGEQTQFTQMVNMIFDFPINDRTTLSFGAGLGGNMVSLDVATPAGVSLDDDYVLAGQLMAGVGFQISRSLELFVDYRYLVSDQPEHSFVFGGIPRVLDYENDVHMVMVGLRYDLSPEPAPQVYTPPPPPTAPPPVAKQYIVFFGWNKSNLTAQAQATVAQAAATAKQVGAASILVVGHTDTSGGTRYNQKLSERRANTVANELARNGIAPEAISAMGKGETELLIQTQDGMREPQNRRVEINL